MSEDDWVPWESDEPAEFEDWFLGDDLQTLSWIRF